MKTALLTIGLFFGLVQLSLAGGNSSIVRIHKVISIKIEEGKVTIIGDGILTKRIMTDAKHGDSTAFGQPTQMLHAKVREGKFELIPYFSRADIAGVPGPSPDNLSPEMKKHSKVQWTGLLATAKTIQAGDAVTIGYQLDRMFTKSVYVEGVLGSGSLTIDTKKNKNGE